MPTKFLKNILTISALSLPALVLAQYPEQPITIVVPTAAGGGNDAMARIISQRMGEKLKQSFIVENKAGGNGAIASEYVAKAKPDGHTILFGYIATHGMNPVLQKLRYDPIKDFEPIGLVSESPTLMVTTKGFKIDSMQSFIAESQKHPDKFNYASAGNGTAPHFAGELFKVMTDAQMLQIPYKGSAPAMTDTVGGQTQIMFPSLFSAYPYVESGQVNAVAIAGKQRVAVLPEVPTLAELGVKGVEVEQWYALFAPASTPAHIVQTLNTTLNEVLQEKEVMQRFVAQGAYVKTGTPEDLKQLVIAELEKWRGVVNTAKLQSQ